MKQADILVRSGEIAEPSEDSPLGRIEVVDRDLKLVRMTWILALTRNASQVVDKFVLAIAIRFVLRYDVPDQEFSRKRSEKQGVARAIDAVPFRSRSGRNK